MFVLFSSTVSMVGLTARLGVSLSVAVAVRTTSVASSYSPPLEAWVSIACSLVPSLSFAAVTRTDRAVFQFAAVNVSDVGLGARPLPAPVIATVTLPPSGSVARRTV